MRDTPTTGGVERMSLETAASLALFLNCSVAKIRKDTRLKRIPFLRVGRAVRFDRSAVLRALAE